MTQRIPCKRCGAEILPATAQATGGVCMACKNGIRKDIEKSKDYYRKEREKEAAYAPSAPRTSCKRSVSFAPKT